MQQAQGDDEAGGSTAPIDLWHETGLREATAIIETRRIASITPPHPGEFLRSKDHPIFREMGAFKGCGVLLRFVWNGHRMDAPQDLANYSGPDVLVDIFQSAEPMGSAEDAGAGGFRWKGKDGTYWCSRIYGTRGPRLRLLGVESREIGRGPDPLANVHRDPAASLGGEKLESRVARVSNLAATLNWIRHEQDLIAFIDHAPVHPV